MAQKPPDLDASGQPPDIDAPSSGVSPWLVGAGAVGAGALGLALHNPGMAKTAVQGLNELRRALMLSGLALPKSTAGAVGGAALSSIERGSMAPLKEMLSMQTLRDAKTAFQEGTPYATEAYGGSTDVLPKIFHLPGRLLGAGDTAAQKAFVRAGLTEEEAAKEMLQAPLGNGPLMSSLKDNPVADYLLPFRRTPINQFTEGFNAMKPSNLATRGQQAALGAAIGAGTLTGAEAEDPKTIALGTAMAGRRGLPFAAAAGVGRYLSSGSKREGAAAMQGLSPVSEYSLSEGVIGPFQNPLNVIPKPAAIGAVDYLGKLIGAKPPDLP